VGLTLTAVGLEYAAGTRYARRALRGVDLSVDVGEVLLVLGPTGSGKSTLLRVAAGVLDATEGSVEVDGRGVDGPAAPERDRRIGLVFQSPETQLFAETVADDVAFGPRNLDMPDPAAAAREALVRVGLDAAVFGPRSPFTLSGGEARRVALAGVLAMDPAYVLLDEPTAGLDAAGRAAVLEAVRATRERSGVVVVTHDAEELLGEADRVILLDAGVVVHAGAAAGFVTNPERFSESGLLAPDVLRAQMLAAGRGGTIPSFTLDVQRAAEAMDAATCGRAS
jgi:energy-coupling factor transport system ATP-binding protein